MIIGGLQKFSLLDYPGALSAVVFTQGCNFRCQFCYNPMLVWPIEVGKLKNIISPESGEIDKKVYSQIQEDGLFGFLQNRVGKLDAVVITGGEPTIHPDLPDFIAKIKKLDYLVKLDTNGTNPKMVKDLIDKKLINYIAMDIKAPEDKYKEIIRRSIDFNKIKKSVKIIKESGLPYEFRTTVVPGLLDKNNIIKMAKIIKGAEKWYLQQFKGNTGLVNKKLEEVKPYSEEELKEMCEAAKEYVNKCEVR